MGRIRENPTNEQHQLMVEDLKAMSNLEVAQKWQLSLSAIRYWRNKTGIYRRKKGGCSKTQEEKIIELRRKKVCIFEIAKKVGVTNYMTSKILYQSGLSSNKPKTGLNYITPENAPPMHYDESQKDSYQLEPSERERFEELKRWKENNYQKLLRQ